jgi:hypothetical protein
LLGDADPVMPKLTFHEGKACDAVIRRIEQRERSRRQNISFPDHDGHPAPIELACEVGDKLYAFEHTGIEPFAGHLKLDAQVGRYLRPIESMVGDLTRNSRIELCIPINAMEGRSRAEILKIQKALANYVGQTAPLLPVAMTSQRIRPTMPVSVPGVPFLVSLHRSDTGSAPGGFFVVCSEPHDLERERLARCLEGYERKSYKLSVWKREHFARTVLIFEENDIFLTNQELIADAVEHVENGTRYKPDEVWLVSSAVEATWGVWWLRIDQKQCDNFSYWGESLSEADPQTLVDLTGR